MSLKWRSLTGERDGPFSYSNSGWKKWESAKVTWFSCTTPGVPDASVGEASRKGKLMGDRGVGRVLWSTSTSLVQSAHSGCPAVLFWFIGDWAFISSSHVFPFTLWGGQAGGRLWWDDQLSPSPTVTGIVSAPSLAEHMTDMWMAGGILCSPRPPPPLRRDIIDIHTIAHLQLPPQPPLCFDSFICKSRDKTYGANLQQINSDPGWLSTLDIHRKHYDTPSTCLRLKLCLIHYQKCVGKACQHKLGRPVICMLPARWHNDENYQRRLILCVRREGLL